MDTVGVSFHSVKRERESEVRIKLDAGATKPSKGTNASIGWDLYCKEGFWLNGGDRKLVKIGIRVELPHRIAAIIKERSGMALKGINVHGGVIDSDYRGEWGVILHNTTLANFYFDSGSKIAQFILVGEVRAEMEVVESLSDTVRGAKGFGSTG